MTEVQTLVERLQALALNWERMADEAKADGEGIWVIVSGERVMLGAADILTRCAKGVRKLIS